MRLLEREAELASLGSAWESAGGGAGRLRGGLGRSGNGKSALLAAAAEQAAARAAVLRARGTSDLERDCVRGGPPAFRALIARFGPAGAPKLFAGAAAPAGVVSAGGCPGTREQAAEGGFAVLNGIYRLATNLAQGSSRTAAGRRPALGRPVIGSGAGLSRPSDRHFPIVIVVALRRDQPAALSLCWMSCVPSRRPPGSTWHAAPGIGSGDRSGSDR